MKQTASSFEMKNLPIQVEWDWNISRAVLDVVFMELNFIGVTKYVYNSDSV